MTTPLPQCSRVGEEQTQKGSDMGCCVPRRDIPHFMQLLRAGKLTVDRRMSARIGPEDLNESLDRCDLGSTVRQILVFDSSPAWRPACPSPSTAFTTWGG